MIVENSLDLPRPFVSAAESDYQYKPKRYSVTAVMKGPREAILQRRHDDEITCDASEMIWAIFGTAVHSVLEQAEETESQLKENKIVVEMPNGYELSGIFDLYDDSTGTVTDYKTASCWKVKFGEFDDWRKQVLCYCWMLRKLGFDAKRGEIVALLKDHSKTKAKIGEHPPTPVYRIGWDFTDGDFEEIGDWLEERFEEIERCEQLPDDELPVCAPEERWHRPGKYAVMKKGRKKAIRLYDDEVDAYDRAYMEGDGYYVEHRPGSDPKCEDYCSAAPFCSYYKEMYGEGADAKGGIDG